MRKAVNQSLPSSQSTHKLVVHPVNVSRQLPSQSASQSLSITLSVSEQVSVSVTKSMSQSVRLSDQSVVTSDQLASVLTSQ